MERKMAANKKRRVMGPSGMSEESVDIVSTTILLRLWHITDIIFKHLDAISLLYCEKVCQLWRDFLINERVWQKVVHNYVARHQNHVHHVGWARLISPPAADLMCYKQTYWKITNLNQNWRKGNRSSRETKKTFHRSGSIQWKFLPSCRAVSVYNSGQGFTVKLHASLGFKYITSKHNCTGTLKNDRLCMDATEKVVVVAGYLARKVWVFSLEEEEANSHGVVTEFLNKITRPRSKCRKIKLSKFIASNDGVSKVCIHSEDRRVAVLKSDVLEIWDIRDVTQEHRFTVPQDTDFLEWKKERIVTAPLHTGIIQVFNTKPYREQKSLEGGFRKIHAMTVYENLIATAESQSIMLWDLTEAQLMVTWAATKTFITAMYMNDTMLVSGSSSGLVKLWDLGGLLSNPPLLTPLRRISMKGILYYPIKRLFQCSYTDLVIVAKYEGNFKKDKVKVVEVKWN